MNAKKLLFAVIFSVSSTVAVANQTTGTVKIIEALNWVGTAGNPNEVLLVKTNESSLTNPAGCTQTDAYNLAAASAISRSMVLTAFTAKSNARLNIFGGGCASDNRPVIVQIALVE